jgi:hypothetical protein
MLLFLLGGCIETDETTWVAFNSADSAVEVTVGSMELLPPEETILTSTTGEVQVGYATVDPGGGPIGTVHIVRIEVAEEFATEVDRASVRTSSGTRGEDEFDLLRDSAGAGIWVGEIESVGEEGEIREDSLKFLLWQAETSSE